MSRISFDFSSQYDPSAPVLEVSLRSYQPHTGVYTGNALIDTGADGSLVPLDILQSIRADFLHMRSLRGITGHGQKVPIYLVAVQIGSHTLQGIQVAGLGETDELILGRDVLNQLRLTLDGLANTTWVEM
jgi:clan AA aspartic protease